jgi:glycosyltransferase involved in cell wall biosynthesis
MEGPGKQKPALIFCHMGLSTFVQTDLDLLSRHYEIISYYYPRSRNFFKKMLTGVWAIIHALYYVPKAKMVYSYFAGYHCLPHVLLGTLFQKRILVTAGGFDTASIPSLHYGVFFRKNMLQYIVRLEYRLAHKIAVVDASLIHNINTYAATDQSGFTSGLLAFCPALAGKLCVVSGCADGKMWTMPPENQLRSGVVFVAVINHWATFLAKGGEIILALASSMPEVQFTLVGIHANVQKIIQGKGFANVRMTPFLDQGKLLKEYQSHSVFLLPSFTEGLPNVLCEAMLCGCVPVVSEVNGMPEAVGSYGFVVRKPDICQWRHAVQQALQSGQVLRDAGRNRILQNYSPQMREQQLVALLKTNE